MQNQFFRQKVKYILMIALFMTGQLIYATELRIKYDFKPKAEIRYSTAVIYTPKKESRKSSIDYLVVNQNIDNVRLPSSNVQVVAAVNYAEQQLPPATLSYSYIDQSKQVAPEPIVVAVRNQSRLPQVTQSSAKRDRVYTYVVGLNDYNQGYSQYAKASVEAVARQIDENRLTGCAIISVNCSRTATDSRDLNVERLEPIANPVDKTKKRQVLTP